MPLIKNLSALTGQFKSSEVNRKFHLVDVLSKSKVSIESIKILISIIKKYNEANEQEKYNDTVYYDINDNISSNSDFIKCIEEVADICIVNREQGEKYSATYYTTFKHIEKTDSGYIIEFDPFFKKYYLKKSVINDTITILDDLTNLKKQSSVVLYTHFYDKSKDRPISYEYTQLRDLLQFSAVTYGSFAEFNRMLKTIQNDILSNTTMYFTYNVIYSDKRGTGFKFLIGGDIEPEAKPIKKKAVKTKKKVGRPKKQKAPVKTDKKKVGRPKKKKVTPLMKLKEMNGFLKDRYSEYEDIVNDTEFSKIGLAEFYRKTGKYLLVTLADDEYTQVFDKDGTFSAQDALSYEHTGKYHGNEKREVGEGEYVELLADAYDVKMFILFFEKGLDMKYLLERRPVYPAINIDEERFQLVLDPDEYSEDEYLFRHEFDNARDFVNEYMKLKGKEPI